MYELKALKEELGDVARDLSTLGEVPTKENRNFTDEEIERFDNLENRKAELEGKIATAERIERCKTSTPANRPSVAIRSAQPQKITARDRQDGFRAFLLHGCAGATCRAEYVERAEKLGINLNSNQLIQRDTPDLGQDLTTAGHGQETIDGDIFVGLMTRLKAFGGIRQVADVFTTENGNPIHYAFADDVGNEGSIVGENTAQDSVSMAYTPISLSAYTYRSGVYPISWQLIQDSRIDIVNDVSRKLAIRIARRQNKDWTIGTGIGQPKGVVTALDSSMVVATAATGAITYADLNGLIHLVDPLYRDEGEGVALMMSDATAAYLEVNLKDTAGRPLFLGPQSFGNLTEAAPARIAIMGKVFPIIINQHMPAMSQTTSPCIAFGWFKSYKVRDVADLRIEVLRERYADLAAVGVQAYARADGALVDKYAIGGLKMKAST
jgi:HK97 family phage major capsid protein